MSIYSILPDAEALLNLEPEELAGVVLEYLNSLSPMNATQMHRGNFSSLILCRSFRKALVLT